jgi:hypothetical protein
MRFCNKNWARWKFEVSKKKTYMVESVILKKGILDKIGT